MKENLIIENFGPIKKIELNDIRPLTILIGESGSGKSTILKVLSLFRWMYKQINIRSYLKHAKIARTGIRFRIESLLRTSGIYEYLHKDSIIRYQRNKYEIKMQNRTVSARITVAKEDLCLDKICFISDKRAMIANFINNRIERKAADYYLQDTIDNFVTAYDAIKQFPLDFLGVSFKLEKQKNAPAKLTIQGESEVNYSIEMKNASSGIQTVTPLAMIIEYYATQYDAIENMNSALFNYMAGNDQLKNFNAAINAGEIEQRNVHILIEEPELSLYPESQKDLMDYLVKTCYHTDHDYNMTLMIATHSPYIVNYLNLLIKRADSNIETKYKLEYSDISVYEVADGNILSLKVDEVNLIDTRVLSDPISDIYAEYNDVART